MKYILIALTLALFACEEKEETPVTLIRAIANTGDWDSIYLYSDGHLVVKYINKDIDLPIVKKLHGVYDTTITIKINIIGAKNSPKRR